MSYFSSVHIVLFPSCLNLGLGPLLTEHSEMNEAHFDCSTGGARYAVGAQFWFGTTEPSRHPQWVLG